MGHEMDRAEFENAEIGFCICHYIPMLSIAYFGLLIITLSLFLGLIGSIGYRKFFQAMSETETETETETGTRPRQRVNSIIELTSMHSN